MKLHFAGVFTGETTFSNGLDIFQTIDSRIINHQKGNLSKGPNFIFIRSRESQETIFAGELTILNDLEIF